MHQEAIKVTFTHQFMITNLGRDVSAPTAKIKTKISKWLFCLWTIVSRAPNALRDPPHCDKHISHRRMYVMVIAHPTRSKTTVFFLLLLLRRRRRRRGIRYHEVLRKTTHMLPPTHPMHLQTIDRRSARSLGFNFCNSDTGTHTRRNYGQQQYSRLTDHLRCITGHLRCIVSFGEEQCQVCD